MLRAILLWIASAGFILAGLNHFRDPEFYRRIIPPGFPAAAILVVISGIGEIAGGIGLLFRPLRRAAAWGLIALLVAVFPANVYMAVAPERFTDVGVPPILLWVRLPLQGVFIAWLWHAALARRPENRDIFAAGDTEANESIQS